MKATSIPTAKCIAAALQGRRSGCGWVARCPAHEDRSPSLSIVERGGKVLVHCHAGCSQEAVIEALRGRGLWPDRKRRPRTPACRAEWAEGLGQFDHELAPAGLWRRAAILLGEETLDWLKIALSEPAGRIPSVGEIAAWTDLLAWWRRLDGGQLVAESLAWKQHHPQLTAGMVRVAGNLEIAELRALRLFLGVAPEVAG